MSKRPPKKKHRDWTAFREQKALSERFMNLYIDQILDHYLAWNWDVLNGRHQTYIPFHSGPMRMPIQYREEKNANPNP